ncbi:uncharacterized protein V1513DRAFT_434579 [Lipomyces chichibuensis]|uniref:uncharacterized protein n=1 Tax=Lipomyces chichibuensis TaxID=1546026 RepID=UPI003343919C
MDNSVLNHIFSDLRPVKDLRDHLLVVVRELPIDQFTRYHDDVNRRIFELIHSTDTYDKLGGITAIDKLIDFDGTEENATNITRFANYLRKVIPSNDVDAMRVATKALGRLAIPGGTLTVEFIEFEVKRALEWLQSYLGCIAGSESYGSERCHGCVACLLEDYLPECTANFFEQAGTFMQKYYNDVCETVLKYKDHRDNLVRRTVLVMMLNLASYNSNDFASKYMQKCMLHLLGQLKKDRERNQVFQSGRAVPTEA